jgi:hypothetical protein
MVTMGGQYLPHLKQDLRQALLDRPPHQSVVNAEVRVDQSVAHAGHVAPRHFRVAADPFRGDDLAGFADDLALAADGTDGLVVSAEFGLCRPGDEPLNALSGRDDIVQE